MKHLFCFGLGYTGGAVGEVLRKQGWQVSGTSREVGEVEALNAKGFSAFRFDGTSPIEENLFDDVTHLLITIPPSGDGDMVFKLHHEILAKRAKQFSWVGYLSTTGVYGDRKGEWVDEETPLAPSTSRGEKRVKAEAEWMSLFKNYDLPVHLFRLAGIYGPDSNQLLKVLNGTARRRIKPGQVFSRIHVEDIIGILIASMNQPHPGEAYNVCDDEAVPPQDVVTYAADLLNMEPPPEIMFAPKDMTPMGLSFFAESKRVSNAKIKQQLDYELKYPTYREGLAELALALIKSK